MTDLWARQKCRARFILGGEVQVVWDARCDVERGLERGASDQGRRVAAVRCKCSRKEQKAVVKGVLG